MVSRFARSLLYQADPAGRSAMAALLLLSQKVLCPCSWLSPERTLRPSHAPPASAICATGRFTRTCKGLFTTLGLIARNLQHHPFAIIFLKCILFMTTAAILATNDPQVRNLRRVSGPNIWRLDSVIACDVRPGTLAHPPPEVVSRLYAELEHALVQMHTHRCSRASDRTFYECLRRRVELPHIIEHIALGLQVLAGGEVSYGHTAASPDPDTWRVVIDFEEELAGLESVHWARQIVGAFAADQRVDIEAVIGRLRNLLAATRPAPSTIAVIREAKRRGVPIRRFSRRSLIQLGLGTNLRRVDGVLSDSASAVAVHIAQDPEAAGQLLLGAGLPTHLPVMVRNLDRAIDIAHEIGYPVSLSLRSRPERECSTDCLDDEEALRSVWPQGIEEAGALLRGTSYGRDYDMLVVDGRVRASVERIGRAVFGDGRSSIRELMRRAGGDAGVEVSADVECTLSAQGRTPDSVLKPAELAILPGMVGHETATMLMDRSGTIHPLNAVVCELAAKTLGLDLAAVRMRSPDLSIPWSENGGEVVGVDPIPDLGMYAACGDEPGRVVGSHVLDCLYPPGHEATIPIVAVTGTNGKTTTTCLIAHLLRARHQTIGIKTTDGVYVGGRRLMEGDVLTALAAPLILSNNEVEAAIIETGRGGILSHGLGFERADVGVVLNVAEDHLGLRGIQTLDELAAVKSVVVQAVKEDGWAVLNAGDPRVYSMRHRTPGRVVVFATDPNGLGPEVAEHLADGGMALFVEDSTYVLLHGRERIPIAEIPEVPLTLGGAARFQHGNILAAVAAAYVLGVDLETIRFGLASFLASPAVVPGRMNLIDVHGTTVLVDYAHNVPAIASLMELVGGLPAKRRTGVLSMPGDRRDEDIRAVGRLLSCLDSVIVKEIPDLRGRGQGEVAQLLVEGLRGGGMKESQIRVILPELDAVRHALADGKVGDLVVLIANQVPAVLELVESAAASASLRTIGPLG